MDIITSVVTTVVLELLVITPEGAWILGLGACHAKSRAPVASWRGLF